MEQWVDGYVRANGIQIHYYRTGGDRPPIVLNHGAMDDGLCWTRVAKELEPAYDVVMLDARGHGLSDSGRGDYASETRSRDMAEAIAALGLEKPVVGGHSLGAEGSMHLAAEYPELARAIFLEDPVITLPGEPTFGGELGMNEEQALKMMQRVMNLIKILPVPLGKLLARRMMPVAPEDEIVPWILSKKRMDKDFFRSLAGSIPGLQVAHLTGTGHDVRRAKFDGYMTALRSFLGKVHP